MDENDQAPPVSSSLVRAQDMASSDYLRLEQVPDDDDQWLFEVPDGDLILIVGERGAKLRVHSQALRFASKVFYDMFGPNFSEGQELTWASLKEIRLEEDDCDAMRAICCVIHHRNDLLDDISPEVIVQIALASDKYDLGNTLMLARRKWLEATDNKGTLRDTAYLLTAAYIFRDTGAFNRHIKHLVLNHIGSYWNLFANNELVELIPSKALCRLKPLSSR